MCEFEDARIGEIRERAKEFRTATEFQQSSNENHRDYSFAVRRKRLDDIRPAHWRKVGGHTVDLAIERSLECRTWGEFKKQNAGLARWVVEQGLRDQIGGHWRTGSNPDTIRDPAVIAEMALPYKTWISFLKAHGPEAQYAQRMWWVRDGVVGSHWKKNKTTSKYSLKIVLEPPRELRRLFGLS